MLYIAGVAAEGAADRKKLNYQSLAYTLTFIPMAFETFGPINSKGKDFFNTLGRRISVCIRDIRDTASSFQRLSLTIQRLNAVCFNRSFCFKNADLDS